MCDAQCTGWSALHAAAYQGHVSVALALLDAGSDISAMSAVCQRDRCPYINRSYAFSLFCKMYRMETRLFIMP
jgi:ankyrin repeat protein